LFEKTYEPESEDQVIHFQESRISLGIRNTEVVPFKVKESRKQTKITRELKEKYRYSTKNITAFGDEAPQEDEESDGSFKNDSIATPIPSYLRSTESARIRQKSSSEIRRKLPSIREISKQRIT
jgi:hypothetical protein